MKHEQPQAWWAIFQGPASNGTAATEVADSGLQVLSEFLQKLLTGPSAMKEAFFKQYYFLILQDTTGHSVVFAAVKSMMMIPYIYIMDSSYCFWYEFCEFCPLFGAMSTI